MIVSHIVNILNYVMNLKILNTKILMLDEIFQSTISISKIIISNIIELEKISLSIFNVECLINSVLIKNDVISILKLNANYHENNNIFKIFSENIKMSGNNYELTNCDVNGIGCIIIMKNVKLIELKWAIVVNGKINLCDNVHVVNEIRLTYTNLTIGTINDMSISSNNIRINTIMVHLDRIIIEEILSHQVSTENINTFDELFGDINEYIALLTSNIYLPNYFNNCDTFNEYDKGNLILFYGQNGEYSYNKLTGEILGKTYDKLKDYLNVIFNKNYPNNKDKVAIVVLGFESTIQNVQ